ncbi:type 1 glutamine amidotransferase domain-containing protein [Lacticaseibacillus hegangensis]|uniref:Type 1 glutamine amidotransferase domain-containing protein n=1 Tax=Lacticaseibacillus hegangensis TaxID=2486010 RepID=A0ABW4CWM0_9LACO|nr:type 1 glutamine amidotransferase domain-containing protein [Lacticaseibacillus hegangensis]
MKKILVVLTNTTQFTKKPEATGLWLGEATEFVDVIASHYQIDYVSPQGGYVPLDPRSLKAADAAVLARYRDREFQRNALCDTLAPGVINPTDYAAIYYTGGHGVMFDFPENSALQTIAQQIYASGGYVTSVCHGIAGLFNLQDNQGQYLIAGRHVTGFTTQEEILSQKRGLVPFLNEKVASDRGAHFDKKVPFRPFAIKDGQLITGQNPWSVKSVANTLLQALTGTN